MSERNGIPLGFTLLVIVVVW